MDQVPAQSADTSPPNGSFPAIEMPQVTWSYSALEAYELCPHNYHQVRVAKAFKEPPSKALDDGNKVHDVIDQHIRTGAALPLGLMKAGQVIERLAAGAHGIKSERQINVDRWWRPTGVFSSDIWLRCKVDLEVQRSHAVVIVDWKTGKVKPNDDQAKINTLASLATTPGAMAATTLFFYTENDHINAYTYTLADVPALLGELRPRLERLSGSFRAQHWAKKPGWKCRFCPVVSCEHNQKSSNVLR